MPIWIRIVLGIWGTTLAVLAILALVMGLIVAQFLLEGWGSDSHVSVVIVNESESRLSIVRVRFPDGSPADRDLVLHEPLPYGETTSYGAAGSNYPRRIVLIGEGDVTLFDGIVAPAKPGDREFTIVVR